MTKYKNKFWNYQTILKALDDGMPADGGVIKSKCDLFTSEISVYTKDLADMGAIKKIQEGKCIRHKNKITTKGKRILDHLGALHELMGE